MQRKAAEIAFSTTPEQACWKQPICSAKLRILQERAYSAAHKLTVRRESVRKEPEFVWLLLVPVALQFDLMFMHACWAWSAGDRSNIPIVNGEDVGAFSSLHPWHNCGDSD